MLSSSEALKQFFGYNRFLDYQQEIVERIAAGDELCVIMPTGAGKSLCYQLPILMTPGYGIVVSPLIALMKDQVDALNARNIPAGCINSMIDFAEQRRTLDRAASGELKLLYVAPERFGVEFFREFLYRTPPKILVVDEAHCISQWGHDFRPAYLRIGSAAAEFNIPQICAFTATATPTVRSDIRTQLHRENMELFVAGFKRPNLAFKVIRASTDNEKIEHLKELLKTPQTTIIYAATRQAVDNIADALGVIAYHAGLTDAQRDAAQERFMNDEHPVLVATNAFGMGIDRADVRRVIHYQLPGSIEAYYQEAGRAGRDGEKAECILLFSYSDRYIQQFLIDMNNPPAEVIETLYECLRRTVRKLGTDRIEVPLKKLAEAAQIKSDGQVAAALSVLEKLDLIHRDFQHPGLITLRFTGNLKQLAILHQQESTQRSRFISRMIRNCGENLLHDQEYSLEKLTEISALGGEQVRRVLNALNHDCLEYQNGFAGRAIVVNDPGKPCPPLDVDEIESKRNAEIARLDEVISYAQSPRCRQAVLIGYFGEELGSWRCGCCDRCAVDKTMLRTPAPEEKRACRAILLAAQEFSGRIGAGKLAKVLTGSSEITGYMQRADSFGALRSWKQHVVSSLIQSLERMRFLERIDREGFPCIRVSIQGDKVLTGHAELMLDLPPAVTVKPKAAVRRPVPDPCDGEEPGETGLYELLRTLRRDIAEKRGLPLYHILTNAELEELAARKPLTAEEARKIKGIGPQKAKFILPPFLKAIREHVKSAIQHSEPENRVDKKS